MTREEKAIIHYDLIQLLTKDTKNDKEFYQRLLCALQIISTELNRFEEDF